MTFDSFTGPTYQLQATLAARERCINWQPTPVRQGGKTRMMLQPTPGLDSFATLSDQPGRGIFGENGRLFAVGGATLFEIDSAGTVTTRGTVETDANPANFATNGDGGDELFVASGGKGYILNLTTNVLTEVVSDVDFAGQIDGFFVALDKDTSTFKISESLDGTTWDASQILQRTSASDAWEAMAIVRREAILIGSRTGEVIFNAGNSPFPFARRQDVFFEVGIEAPRSLSSFGQSVAWLGRDKEGGGKVFWLNGYRPEKISTESVEWFIQQYRNDGVVNDAIGWSYSLSGNHFYVLDFPTAGKTWAFSLATRMWHELGYWDSGLVDFTSYRPRFQTEMFRRNLTVDRSGTMVWSLNPETFTDADGLGTRRLRMSPHISQEHKRMFYQHFELEAQRGVGLTSGQGSDPQIALCYSNDGGHTWGTTRTRSLGRLGDYDTRIRWERCGSGRDRVFQVWMSDPVYAAILGAYIGVKPGRH